MYSEFVTLYHWPDSCSYDIRGAEILAQVYFSIITHVNKLVGTCILTMIQVI